MGNHRLYPAADALQRPLRSRFRAQLTAGVRVSAGKAGTVVKGASP